MQLGSDVAGGKPGKFPCGLVENRELSLWVGGNQGNFLVGWCKKKKKTNREIPLWVVAKLGDFPCGLGETRGISLWVGAKPGNFLVG